MSIRHQGFLDNWAKCHGVCNHLLFYLLPLSHSIFFNRILSLIRSSRLFRSRGHCVTVIRSEVMRLSELWTWTWISITWEKYFYFYIKNFLILGLLVIILNRDVESNYPEGDIVNSCTFTVCASLLTRNTHITLSVNGKCREVVDI